MAERRTGKEHRSIVFTPDARSKDASKFYLSRTTYLWNYLVDLSEAIYDEYLRESLSKGQSQDLDDQLDRKVWELFEDIYRYDYRDVVPECWLSFVEKICQLPRHMTQQRLTELLSAYKASAHKSEGSPGYRNRPQRKTNRSAQSVMFSQEDIVSFNGTSVVCQAVSGYEITIPLTGVLRSASDTLTKDRIEGIMLIKPHQSTFQTEQSGEFGPVNRDQLRVILWIKPE